MRGLRTSEFPTLVGTGKNTSKIKRCITPRGNPDVPRLILLFKLIILRYCILDIGIAESFAQQGWVSMMTALEQYLNDWAPSPPAHLLNAETSPLQRGLEYLVS